VQRPDESVEAYYKNFKRTRDKLTVLGDPIPDPANEVQHFLSNLDQARYGPLLTDYENRVNGGQAYVYPPNTAAACEQVLRWKPIHQINPHKSTESSVIFHTTKGHDATSSKKKGNKVKVLDKPPKFKFPVDFRKCSICLQRGHIFRYCGYNELALSEPTEEDLKLNTEWCQQNNMTDKKESEVFMTRDTAEDTESDEDHEEGNIYGFGF
jgi:hypothetical protein